jgi:hypothetical protein
MAIRFHSQPAFWQGLPSVLCTTVFLAALSIRFAPFGTPLPVYLDVVQAMAGGRGLITSYTPVGYPLFLASAIRIAGFNGIFCGQAVLYILTVLLAWSLISSVTPKQGVAWLGAMAVAVHPQLVLNIKRISDQRP